MRGEKAEFALRFVRRREGTAGIVYQRKLDDKGRERLQRIATLSPLALQAGMSLVHAAIGRNGLQTGGAFIPLAPEWGTRLACYGILSAGLRHSERLARAALHLQYADPVDSAWWLSMMTREDNVRAIRALRILTEAVE